jgi:hypothetical protein
MNLLFREPQIYFSYDQRSSASIGVRRRFQRKKQISAGGINAPWLQAPILEEVLNRCKRDEKAVALAEKVRNKLLNGTLPFDDPLFHLRAMDSWQVRLRYCLRRAFEPNQTDLAFMTLPRGLYFVVRPFRVVWVGIKRFLRTADRR